MPSLHLHLLHPSENEAPLRNTRPFNLHSVPTFSKLSVFCGRESFSETRAKTRSMKSTDVWKYGSISFWSNIIWLYISYHNFSGFFFVFYMHTAELELNLCKKKGPTFTSMNANYLSAKSVLQYHRCAIGCGWLYNFKKIQNIVLLAWWHKIKQRAICVHLDINFIALIRKLAYVRTIEVAPWIWTAFQSTTRFFTTLDRLWQQKIHLKSLTFRTLISWPQFDPSSQSKDCLETRLSAFLAASNTWKICQAEQPSKTSSLTNPEWGHPKETPIADPHRYRTLNLFRFGLKCMCQCKKINFP